MTEDTKNPAPQTRAEGEAAPLNFTYRNWRGEVGERSVYPIRMEYGSTEWHPERQWLLVAYDIGKGADRSFAFKDIIPEIDAPPLQSLEVGAVDQSYGEAFAVGDEVVCIDNGYPGGKLVIGQTYKVSKVAKNVFGGARIGIEGVGNADSADWHMSRFSLVTKSAEGEKQ